MEVLFQSHICTYTVVSVDRLGKCVGVGQTASVYAARREETGETVAIKVFDCRRRGSEEILQEMSVYEQLLRGGDSRRKWVCR